MNPADAARLLGIAPDAPWDEVRRAFRARIRTQHPDTRPDGDDDAPAVAIIEAYSVLEAIHRRPPDPSAGSPAAPDPAPAPRVVRFDPTVAASGEPPASIRIDDDTLALDAPADEAFRWLVEVAHDIGEITYLDRSVPILEVLCRFVGEPATSLVVTVQGRMDRTDAICHVESIEARPAPPAAAVVDLLEDAFAARRAAG